MVTFDGVLELSQTGQAVPRLKTRRASTLQHRHGTLARAVPPPRIDCSGKFYPNKWTALIARIVGRYSTRVGWVPAYIGGPVNCVFFPVEAF